MVAPRPQSRIRAVTLGVVCAATAFALLGLGRQPLWFDEVATAHAAALPWAGLRTLLGQTDANHGTYYTLLHALGADR